MWSDGKNEKVAAYYLKSEPVTSVNPGFKPILTCHSFGSQRGVVTIVQKKVKLLSGLFLDMFREFGELLLGLAGKVDRHSSFSKKRSNRW